MTIPTLVDATNAAEQDILVLIGFHTGEESKCFGTSEVCVLDEETNAPRVAAIHIRQDLLSGGHAKKQLALRILRQELAHVLGFNIDLIQKFFEQDLPILKESVRERNIFYLTTPTVRHLAQDHYRCSRLLGMELQNSMGAPSAYWHEKYAHGEFMTTDTDIFAVSYSQFTLAVFADSPWYSVNYA
jgi:hypothetical protein